MWRINFGTVANSDPDGGVEADMLFNVKFNAYATNSKVDRCIF